MSTQGFKLLWENVFLLLHMFGGLCTREYGRASSPRDDVQLPGTSHTQTCCMVVSTNTPQTHKHRGYRYMVITSEKPACHMAERAEVGTSDANSYLAWSVPEMQYTGGRQKSITVLWIQLNPTQGVYTNMHMLGPSSLLGHHTFPRC